MRKGFVNHKERKPPQLDAPDIHMAMYSGDGKKWRPAWISPNIFRASRSEEVILLTHQELMDWRSPTEAKPRQNEEKSLKPDRKSAQSDKKPSRERAPSQKEKKHAGPSHSSSNSVIQVGNHRFKFFCEQDYQDFSIMLNSLDIPVLSDESAQIEGTDAVRGEWTHRIITSHIEVKGKAREEARIIINDRALNRHTLRMNMSSSDRRQANELKDLLTREEVDRACRQFLMFLQEIQNEMQLNEPFIFPDTLKKDSETQKLKEALRRLRKNDLQLWIEAHVPWIDKQSNLWVQMQTNQAWPPKRVRNLAQRITKGLVKLGRDEKYCLAQLLPWDISQSRAFGSEPKWLITSVQFVRVSDLYCPLQRPIVEDYVPLDENGQPEISTMTAFWGLGVILYQLVFRELPKRGELEFPDNLDAVDPQWEGDEMKNFKEFLTGLLNPDPAKRYTFIAYELEGDVFLAKKDPPAGVRRTQSGRQLQREERKKTRIDTVALAIHVEKGKE